MSWLCIQVLGQRYEISPQLQLLLLHALRIQSEVPGEKGPQKLLQTQQNKTRISCILSEMLQA